MLNHRNPLANPKCLLPEGRGLLGVNPTHRAQSTAMMRVMSSVGSPTEVSTMTMVTSPAWGMPAAPMLAAVAVMLQGGRGESKRRSRKDREHCWGPASKEESRMPRPLGTAIRSRGF